MNDNFASEAFHSFSLLLIKLSLLIESDLLISVFIHLLRLIPFELGFAASSPLIWPESALSMLNGS
jgi:hypothetical protein